jgi:pyrroloquinoline-quinone synthase
MLRSLAPRAVRLLAAPVAAPVRALRTSAVALTSSALRVGKVRPGASSVRVSPQVLPSLHRPTAFAAKCIKEAEKDVEENGFGHAPGHVEEGDVEGPLVPLDMVEGYEQLLAYTASHPFWNNLIFRNRLSLTSAEWKFFWEQYFHYSRNFTRYLSGLMYRCDDDLLRARLTQNLWEEGGGAEPEKRHSQLFRNFLTKTLKTEPQGIVNEPCTVQYVNQYLDGSANADALYSAAFLSLGTEGIVSPMYARLVDGMLSKTAGFPSKELLFFHIHIGCDDDHAGTLAEIMFKYAKVYQEKHPQDRDGWIQVCTQATDDALNLRKTFFDHLYTEILVRRQAASSGKEAAKMASTMSAASSVGQQQASMC